jgi:hypothetical protein
MAAVNRRTPMRWRQINRTEIAAIEAAGEATCG